ncbi:hypothetical protein M4A30_004973 [Escherichia coli]|nr:hypothetical protein [Escherichia coli]
MRHKKTRGARVMRFSFAQDANPGTRFMRCAGIIAIFAGGDQAVFFSDIQGQKTPDVFIQVVRVPPLRVCGMISHSYLDTLSIVGG